MPIYVDELNDYSHKSNVGEKARKYGTIWCHLYPEDVEDPVQLEELHALAKMIGLQRKWFQDRKHFPHYDLTPSKREAAIAAGALEDDGRKVMREQIRKRHQKEQNNG